MTPDYKAEKEASVAYLSGGGVWEINFVTLIAPAAVFLWSILQTRQSFFKPYTVPAAITDFLLNSCGILFATTVYSGAPQILLGLLVLPAVATLLQPASPLKAPPKPPVKEVHEAQGNGKDKLQNVPASGPESKDLTKGPLPVKPFITAYRGAMMIITCTSILAVDFPVFPRRFAKTEAFGTSLMDLGVGSFVFAAGIAAARPELKARAQNLDSSFVERMKAALRPSLPLLALGFVRMWSVKGLDYAEHVSEYGVHWNFFFTLALLPPVVALLLPALRFIRFYNIFAFFFAIAYELVLYLTPDLKRYIILAAREPGNWFSQNREGVFSFFGYLAIFIAGMGIGLAIMPRDPDPEEDARRAKEADPLDEDADWLDAVISGKEPNNLAQAWNAEPPPLKPELPTTAFYWLLLSAFLWFVASVWAMWNYGPALYVSRRMANLAYVCWVCSFNTAQLLLFCGIEKLMCPNLYKATDGQTEKQRIQDATSKVLQAFNRNGLAIFLLANLLTGAVNMSMKTLHMGDVEAMVILTSYIGVICTVALLLDKYDVSIKL
ncbi:gpi-anchored wall transfer protein 1 [Teratosphaeria destructans]|uniref:GPI-anchored wall transfer protein n=1 Tax=Teratosphaeria destructans TaxID=418781 RepID=A0A9W7W0Z5_9PEZI|nr:gpi-anchored wall transfer protein 1 [Teratosphaeria destructans]